MLEPRLQHMPPALMPPTVFLGHPLRAKLGSIFWGGGRKMSVDATQFTESEWGV